MTITRVHGCAVLGALALAAAASVSAQDRGAYAGVSMGMAHYPDDGEVIVINTPLDVEGDSTDKFAYSVDAGYRFNRYFATELGYTDLGEATATLIDPTGGNAGQGKLRYSAKGPTLAFVGFLPFGKWEPFLKVGFIVTDVELTADGTLGTAPFSGRATDDGTKIYWGTGVGCHVSDRWNIRLAVDYYESLGDDDGTALEDLFVATLGVHFKF